MASLPTYTPAKAPSTEYDHGRDRSKRGQCITCGIQTHKVLGLLSKSFVPITNEHVLCGRCIPCHPLPPDGSSAPARPAVGEAPGVYAVAVPSGDIPSLAKSVGVPFYDNAGALPSPTAPPITKLMAVEDPSYAFNPSIVMPPPEIPAAPLLDNSAVTPLQNQDEVLNDGPPAPMCVQGNDESAATSVHDPWWKRHQRWIIGGFLLIFIGVAAIVGVTLTLSSQNGSGNNTSDAGDNYDVGGGQNTLNPSPPPSTLATPSPPPTSPPIETLPFPNPTPTAQPQFSSLELIPNEEIVSHDSNVNVAIYGDTSIVGAPANDNKRGSAFVYVRDENGEWELQAKLVALDGAADDWFGWSVGIYGDTVIIGAYNHDDNGGYSGSAHVFVRNGATWSHQAKLLSPNGAASDLFGRNVGIHGDTAIVGASGDDDNGSDSGSAHVFARNGATWSHQVKLLAPDGAANDQFGVNVGIDGDTVIVGAYWDDDNGSNSGSAHLFVRNGATWAHQAKLLAPGVAANEYFGCSVGIDGDAVIVGAVGDDDNGSNSGSAHVFVRNGVTWSHQTKLLAPDGAANDQFGWSVEIYGDTVIVGARRYDDDGGSTHVFVRNGVTWTRHAKLVAPKSGNRFGQSVGIYDGTTISGSGSGEVYVFSG